MEKNVRKVRSKHLHTTAHLSSTNEVNDAPSTYIERPRTELLIPIVQKSVLLEGVLSLGSGGPP